MRSLYFTTGSPFARAVRIVLAEKGLPFTRHETYTTPSVAERALTTPTLQVPMLVDGEVRLWDSTVIIEYLMSTYPTPLQTAGEAPLADDYVRPDHLWEDRLVHATLQTLGVSTATVSQLLWSGVAHEDNAFATRCALRIQHLLDWFEQRLVGPHDGFIPNAVSPQDILLAAWCQFIERRPLRIAWRADSRPKLAALVARMATRRSFSSEPALWWEPGVTYADTAEVAWAASKTIDDGPDFASWRAARGC